MFASVELMRNPGSLLVIGLIRFGAWIMFSVVLFCVELIEKFGLSSLLLDIFITDSNKNYSFCVYVEFKNFLE